MVNFQNKFHHNIYFIIIRHIGWVGLDQGNLSDFQVKVSYFVRVRIIPETRDIPDDVSSNQLRINQPIMYQINQ